MKKLRYLYDIMSRDPDNLTDQQRRFVDAYLADENLSVQEAAIQAGYTEGYASSQAYQLLRNPRVKLVLDKEMAARARRTRITQDRVLREIASVAFSSVDDYIIAPNGDITLKDGADIRAMKAIKSVERDTRVDKEGNCYTSVKIKLWDKPKSMEMLSRHLNLFREDQEAGAPKLETLSDEELAKRLEAAVKKLKGV